MTCFAVGLVIGVIESREMEPNATAIGFAVVLISIGTGQAYVERFLRR